MADALEQLVNEVIEVTGASKPALFEEDAPVLSERALDDGQESGFYLVGLIGGKEVGKSALVNALVGREVTLSTSFGEGTQIVTAYAHASQANDLRQLLDREVPGKYKIVTHEIQPLSRQVLLDLPDIDSHWAEHVEVTRKMLRQMLFPIWLQSVEKYADLQPQQMLLKVAAGNSAGNFIFCLNKVDQLMKSEGAEAVEELRRDYAQRLARLLSLPESPRIFMISARQADQFDLPPLRDMLNRQKTVEEVDAGRQAAAAQQGSSVLGWIRRQNLPQQAQRLANLEEQAQELLNERLGSPLLEQSIPAMLDDPAHRLSLMDDCLKQRCANWPFVNVIQGVAAPLAALFRRRLALDQQRTLESAQSLVEQYLRPQGKDLSQAIQTTFAQLQQSQPMVSSLYRDAKWWEALQADLSAGDLQISMAQTLTRQRAIAASQACGRAGPVGAMLRWLLTIGALLWFPIVQPILEAALQPSPVSTVREIALKIVQALSVTFLLKTMTFLILWFVIIWLLVRWDTARRVDKQLQRWKVSDSADGELSLPGQVMQWLETLTQPIQVARLKLESLVQRAEELEGEVGRKAA